MAKTAAWKINWAINSVQVESFLTSAEQNVKQETIKVDGFDNTGPRRVVGNYDYDYKGEANWDGASGAIDATIFGLVGSAGVASAFDPTGNAGGANDPNYDSTSVVLEDYSIKGAVGGAVTCSFSLAGNAALARNLV